MTGVRVTAEAFLGVERSLLGRRWRARGGDERAGLAIAQRLALPEIVGRLLAGRGIAPDAAESFLSPHLARIAARSLALPRHGQGGRRASSARCSGGETHRRLRRLRRRRRHLLGAAARFFAAAGGRSASISPTGMKEGYGPNLPALLALQAEGVRLVITVDCGITAFEPLAAAAAAGLEVIVVDHHVAEPRCPRPSRWSIPTGSTRPAGHGQLAAVGVAFLLVVAVNRALRRAGWYGAGRAEPDLKRWLDLVALGTVCDVVPLTGRQSRAGGPGAEGDGAARQYRAGGAGRRGAARASRPAAITRASSWARGSMPAAGSGEADLGARLLVTEDEIEAARLRPPPRRLQRRAPRRSRSRSRPRPSRRSKDRGPGAHGARPGLRGGRAAGMPA